MVGGDGAEIAEELAHSRGFGVFFFALGDLLKERGDLVFDDGEFVEEG